MTIEKFHSSNITAVRKQFEQALKIVGETYGYEIKLGNMKYSETSFDAKIEVVIPGKQSSKEIRRLFPRSITSRKSMSSKLSASTRAPNMSLLVSIRGNRRISSKSNVSATAHHFNATKLLREQRLLRKTRHSANLFFRI